MKILITGANGFTGKQMVSFLSNGGNELILTDKANVPKPYCCDLTNYTSTRSLLKKTSPAQLYHFSGTFTNDYEQDYKANVLTTKNILDSILELKLKTRVLLIGSSGEYGIVKEEDNPVSENHPLNPVSVYGLTKVYQTMLMNLYCQLHNMDIVMARTFNLSGKGISSRLFIGNLYHQIELYKAGKIKKLEVGNTSHRRDFIDIKQAIVFYKLIMENGKKGEIYNVGSGKSETISTVMKKIIKKESISSLAVKHKRIEGTNRIDIPDLRADISKLLLL